MRLCLIYQTSLRSYSINEANHRVWKWPKMSHFYFERAKRATYVENCFERSECFERRNGVLSGAKMRFLFGFSHTVRKAVELFYLRFHIACASNPSKWWNAAPCWKREEDQEQGSLLYYSKKKSKKYIFLKQCSFGSKWFLPLCCRRKSRKLCCGWVGCALKNAPKSPRIWEGFLSRKRGNGQREPLCELWDDATTGDITVMRSSG